MPINNIFRGTIAQAKNALDLRLQRQGLLQSNVANIETPGYQAQDFRFAEVMQAAMLGKGALAQTNDKHFQVDPAESVIALQTRLQTKPPDLDEEMLKLAENNLLYQTVTQIIGKKFDGLKYAIDEGGK